MARSNFTFRRATLWLLGWSLALTLIGWSPAAPPAADASTWPALESSPSAVVPHADILGVGRLAAFAASAPQPRATSRSPFALNQTTASEKPDRIQLAPLRAVVPAPSPSLEDTTRALPALVGIAVDEPQGGPARTAVFITSDGTVEFAGRGQSVAGGRFRIVNVTADGAVLVNDKTGVTARLSLR